MSRRRPLAMAVLFSFGWCAVAIAAPLHGELVTKGNGSPISEVQVLITGAQNVQSDLKGTFTVELTDGPHTLTFDSVDHKPKTIQITMPLDRPIRVFLEPIDEPLEIVVESFTPSPHVSRHSVDAEMAYETPGTHDDSVRLVQALPGVMVQREFAPSTGDVSVRASRPGDNRYFLDGIEIPYLYHFNQYASVFPTSQIQSLELYSSTFGAEFGDAIGAVVDASSKSDVPDALHGGVSFNTIMVGADVRTPLSKSLWASASIRRSYHDIAGDSNPQYLVWPRFSDFSLRLERVRENSQTALFAYGARDRYTRAAGELDLLDPLEASQSTAFAYQRQFQIWGLRHQFNSHSLSGRMVFGYTRENRYGILDSLGFEAQTSGMFTQRTDLNGPVSSTTTWSAGWELRQERTNLAISGAGPTGLLVAAEAPGLARGTDVDLRTHRTRIGAYGQLNMALGPIRLFPGFRVSTDPMTQTTLVSPRASLRWQAAEQTALKAAFGHYSQTAETAWLLPGTGTPGLTVPTSWQATVGIEQTIANRLELQLEGYHKELDNPIINTPGESPKTGERGRVSGAEAVLRYRLRGHFFLWGWFGWSQSRIVTKQGETLNGDYDQPLTAGLVASWDPTKHWNIAVRYRLGSGLPYTPVMGGAYDASSDQYVPIPGTLNAARMPTYQKIDASVGYTAYFNRWTLNLRAEVWVVPKSATQLYPTYNFDFSETEWVTGIPILPLLAARATF